jgi:hypothetical protein
MLNRMSAELLFHNPAHVNPAIAELIERNFDFQVHEDMIDECGPAVFILVTVISELDVSAFFGWVKTIVEPFDGEVLEAGFADDRLNTALHHAVVRWGTAAVLRRHLRELKRESGEYDAH